ncbi:hypothetical protein LAZ67_20001546 [Cordylochernes scorpioides]|uniref:Uncharacterized protein n=1 Tax=Cordylochernes scorpioides TaxID=51811 RepID=A0ABY6LMF1_9ARAC|nr:hypothetical protein LAZ67_20001546 [Cordylochernes scorpioides]
MVLKERLLQRFGRSHQVRTARVSERKPIADQKPSIILAEMRHQVGSSFSEEALKVLWTQRLSQSIQRVLSVMQELNLAKMAELADDIHKATRSTMAVFHQMDPDQSITAEAFQHMAGQNQTLQTQVNEPKCPKHFHLSTVVPVLPPPIASNTWSRRLFPVT